MKNENKEIFKKMLRKFRTNVYCHGRNFVDYDKTEEGQRTNEKDFVITNQIIDLLAEAYEKGVTESTIRKFLKLDEQFA